MKKLIIVFLIFLLSFFGGYRLGIHKNNDYTIAYMLSLSDQIAASKSIISIKELNRIKSMKSDSNEMICALQKEIIRISEDLKKCESNDACISKIKGDYASVKSLIFNSNNIECN